MDFDIKKIYYTYPRSQKFENVIFANITMIVIIAATTVINDDNNNNNNQNRSVVYITSMVEIYLFIHKQQNQ